MNNIFKKKLWVVAIGSVLVVLAGGLYFYENMDKYLWPNLIPPEYSKVDMDKPLRGQTRIVEVAGRTFEIPLMYVDARLDRGKVQKDGILFVYMLPDFKSKLEFRSREEYDKAFQGGGFGQTLIQPEAIRPSFNVSIASLRRGIKKEEPAGTFDGLEVYKWYHQRKEKLVFYYEMYLEKDKNGNIISFIQCSTKEKGAITPGCSHRFRDKGLLYKVSYRKKNYLSSWREQQRAAIEFIDRFEIKSNAQIN